MGNCIRHEKSSLADDDDDWGSLASTHRQGDDHGEVSIMEKEKLLGGTGDENTREVKITISKKELERLIQNVNMQGLTLEQVLVMMVKGGGDGYEAEHHRSWRPMLQSIPEVN